MNYADTCRAVLEEGIRMPKKIYIIGSVGSGKSTLARHISSKLQIPYYELDNVVWRRVENGDDIRNSVEERDAILHHIITADEWIIEGVHYKWVLDGFDKADLIIYLDTAIWKRNIRIFKRFAVQKLGLEKGNYKQSLKMLSNMYKWSYSHKKIEKSLIFEQLKPYTHKLLILSDNNEIDQHIVGTKVSNSRARA
jgi:adenylate kinase family enzyme